MGDSIREQVPERPHSDILQEKSTRQLEYSRQRAFKGERTGNWRTQKNSGCQCWWESPYPTTTFINVSAEKEWLYYSSKPVGRGRKTTSGRRGYRGLKVTEDGDFQEELEEDTPTMEQWEEHVFDGEENVRAKMNGGVEVDLEKMIRPGKARKSRAGEFEVVPGVRSVVALSEEFTADAPMAIEDEEWDYLDDDEETRRTLYADLLR